MEPFKDEKRSACLYGIGFRDLVHSNLNKRKRVSAFIIDETVMQIGNQHFGYGFVLNQFIESVLGIHISRWKKYVCSREFHQILVKKYGRHTVYTDGGTGILKHVDFYI